MPEPIVCASGVHKSYASRKQPRPVKVLAGVNIEVHRGSVVALYGPNGCGKTTLLNLLGGLGHSDQGRIHYPAHSGRGKPKTGYAFQSFRESLLPWRSALDNVALPLVASGVPTDVARGRTETFLNSAGFTFPRDRYPYELSSGQQQAAALASVLIQKPEVVLLDEPFSALDHTFRLAIQCQLFEELEHAATVLTSHNLDELLFMSDLVHLLSPRPAVVLETVNVPFPKPRTPDLLLSTQFSELRRSIMAFSLRGWNK